MKITPKNILRHELIGLEACVVKSKNPSQVGICGLILDETYKTIVIGVPGGPKKRIFKAQVVLRIKLPDGKELLVDGAFLVGRPEERLKRRVMLW
ncbi:ribonuclease P protein component 1 [Thermofilum pendens]|uniref:Ribonuclease P protein component 1 n=1 Tax=Thermofilum pendens (strain DSM 2475 / Hrk 5) TaxID=368408 RepID=RNP1_THEPD|nr:ribonuclease P protein subunit [Thermofilum pendens]A1RXG4.1 RecName: Full=Ribonuclease P protein component 1; Short=RNase P component 1; AltName: Full=Rpp29 [Thermofilum pendens Hrk 5]ABL77894.1 Ribonuclease P subunit [Thermofilum pendens Hrk 5]